MGIEDREYYREEIKRKTRAERERSYYYPSVKEDHSPDWPQGLSRIPGTRRRVSRWLYGGSLAVALTLGGKALLAAIGMNHLPVPQIGTPKQAPQQQPTQQPERPPTRTVMMSEMTIPTPPPPTATRPTTPPASSTPGPVQTLSSTPRRTLQACMAPGSNEVNAKVLACMNGQ
ncbi:hypothetical protein [Plasticicumulans lactativorans]|uniref:hypothetical protein n=1 Tax=Plasticicumulans lactativorans TaxID=1133106 RepID=UPI00104AB8D0|nr:hypothetical protein [Plasticicumulans lactativorans]